ncbi:hypothetical protein jhhlp_002712 [Lomentospora prolificans]|uniref:Phospholipase/carboxylesterase/thioesterase domain-containing protein n=1 Tax=Lomentospora prolificans TaxID=41688 RepID=A0A2N3NET5_9PEZI|nr:hypothetical protein jhhlp_002712 [Lomentospora prolificans]
MVTPGALLVIPPASQLHTHTVVFLHGRGDSARKFAEGLHYFADSRNRSLFEIFPTFRWVFPQAPLSVPASRPKDRINQWFDVWNVRDYSEKEELQAPGLSESVVYIRRLLEQEAAALGGRWDRVVLAGISQGGATSMHTLLNLKASSMQTGTSDGAGPDPGRKRPSLGAVIGVSCRLPLPRSTLAETRRALGIWEGGETDDDEIEVLKNTPILLEHCADDPLVLVDSGRALRDSLVEYGGQVTWKEYPDGGHWLNWPAGAEDVVEFLQTVFTLPR